VSLDAPPALDLAGPLGLSPEVALREEPFGALAYHYGTRRLVFLKSARLVELVERLGEFASGESALAEVVPESERGAYRRALSRLAAADIVRGR
jgi:putative mycofactocin binding protein MftB